MNSTAPATDARRRRWLYAVLVALSIGAVFEAVRWIKNSPIGTRPLFTRGLPGDQGWLWRLNRFQVENSQLFIDVERDAALFVDSLDTTVVSCGTGVLIKSPPNKGVVFPAKPSAHYLIVVNAEGCCTTLPAHTRFTDQLVSLLASNASRASVVSCLSEHVLSVDDLDEALGMGSLVESAAP